MADRRLLLAGSVGPERVPARPDRDDADWYLPLHLRDERAARERIAAQVAAGADVVVAPTWMTHRQALLPLGETRRAASWSRAAIRVARDGLEIGLERRAALLAEAGPDDPRHDRPRPLVAASLPALDDDPEPESGRLLPREAATERDYRDQAGILADAQPDLLLVEGQRTEIDARIALAEAADTGLPVWAALSTSALATSDLEDWLEWCRATAVTRLLLPPPLDERITATEGDLPWGGLTVATADIRSWLEAGASAMALLDGASTSALERHRAAIDDYERVEIEAARATERRWAEHVQRAAAMAPGGAAVWIGEAPATPLPDGFDWLLVDPAEAPRLPLDHFRLVVLTEPVPGDPARWLERGGILVSRVGARDWGGNGLSLLVADPRREPALSTYRRERS